jgi:acyl-coenzyme A thioesterase PaaI-like protein
LPAAPNVITELGLRLEPSGDSLRGEAEVRRETCLPGTTVVRTSVLATWSDVITGLFAATVSPRIPLTLDLEVQVHRPAQLGTRVAVTTEQVKNGRTVSVFEATFCDAASGDLLAVSYVSFVGSPDPAHVFTPGTLGYPRPERLLDVDLAERVQRRVIEPGTIEMPRIPDGLNATGAIQGGLVSFAIEEAALSAVEGPALVDALNVRYLRPFMIGPARAVATGTGNAFAVRMADLGTGKLGALATVRLTPIDRDSP